MYDQVIDFLDNRENKSSIPVHVLNIDIPDNHDEAIKGSFLISDLATMLSKTTDLDDEIDEVCYTFETENNKDLLHCIMFYWIANKQEKRNCIFSTEIWSFWTWKWTSSFVCESNTEQKLAYG